MLSGDKIRYLLAIVRSAIYCIEIMGDNSPISVADLKEIKAALEEMLSE
jgi:hypothetical protein